MNTDRCPKMVYPRTGSQTPVQLAGFYSLASPKSVVGLKEVRIQPLTPKEAYLELTENSFNTTVRTPERLRSQFGWATELVKRVPVKRLSYPRLLHRLPDVIQAIKSDLAAQDMNPSRLAATLEMRMP